MMLKDKPSEFDALKKQNDALEKLGKETQIQLKRLIRHVQHNEKSHNAAIRTLKAKIRSLEIEVSHLKRMK